MNATMPQQALLSARAPDAGPWPRGPERVMRTGIAATMVAALLLLGAPSAFAASTPPAEPQVLYKGLYANAYARYWPNVATSLTDDKIALAGTNGTVSHSAHDWEVFANVSLGYAFDL